MHRRSFIMLVVARAAASAMIQARSHEIVEEEFILRTTTRQLVKRGHIKGTRMS